MGGAGSPFGDGFPGFGDLFDAFFSGMGGASAGGRRSRRPGGADLRYDLRITFDEAVHGVEKEIEFDVSRSLWNLRRQWSGTGKHTLHLFRVRRPG